MNSPESSGYTPEIVDEAQELKTEQKFDSKFSKIMERSLSPENIDTYAEDALKDLISLVNQCTEEYASAEQTELTRKELEDAALKYYGLPGIPQTLDHISQKESEIRAIDRIIRDAIQTGTVIIPPESSDAPIVQNNGEFREKLTIPRTKTILFILSADFDVDVHDHKQLIISTGILTDKMMRRTSYSLIEVPNLSRTIFCCDEEENITYIFSNEVLEKNDLSVRELAEMTKPNIDELLETNQSIGKRVVYSTKFVHRIIDLIKDIKSESKNENPEAGQYLYHIAPEGTMGLTDFVNKIGVSRDTVEKCAKRLGIKIEKYRLPEFNRSLFSLTPKQQGEITQELVTSGTLVEDAPEGYLTIGQLADKLGSAYGTIKGVILGMSIDINTIPHHKYDHGTALSLSPQLQASIIQELHDQKKLLDEAPEGYLSNHQIASTLGVHVAKVNEVIDQLGVALKDAKEYGRTAKSVRYSPQQQALITQELHKKGGLADEAPEGYLSIPGLADKLGVSPQSIDDAIVKLGNNLEKIDIHKFYNEGGRSLSPKNQALITQELHDRGTMADKAPEGNMALSVFAKKLDISQGDINKMVLELESLGKIDKVEPKYHGPRPRRSLTPKQQAIITQELHDKGKLLDRPPKGFMSTNGIAKQIGVDFYKVKDAIDELGAEIGHIKEYKKGKNYSPEHQEKIIKKIQSMKS